MSKIFVCLNLLKRRILCGLKKNKNNEKNKHISKKLVEIDSPTQIYVQWHQYIYGKKQIMEKHNDCIEWYALNDY